MIRQKSGRVINWTFNNVQATHHNKVYEYTGDHTAVVRINDNIILKSRQYGQSTYEIGDMYHDFCWKIGTNQKVVTFKDKTATLLKLIIDLMHETACEYFWSVGLDPDQYLPYVPRVGNQHELVAPFVGSRIEFTTEGAKGSGRAVTLNRLYGTEYSEWMNVTDVMSGFAGSLSDDGNARVVLDFTGQGIGNAAYHEYWAAKRGESVYTAHFYGRDDYPYKPEFLDKQRQRLKGKFDQEYPAKDTDAFLKDKNAIYNPAHIDRSKGEVYFGDTIPVDERPHHFYTHGIDTAEGVPNGDNAAISGFEITTMIEAYEPKVGKHSPRRTAHLLRRVLEEYPGIAVVEDNNTGHACIVASEDLELRSGPFAGRMVSEFIFLQEKRDKRGKLLPRREWKIGYRTDGKSKQLFEDEMEDYLWKEAVTIVSENGRVELTQYQVLSNGKHGAPTQVSDDGTRFFDDEAISKMLALMGVGQTVDLMLASRVDTTPVIAGSMRE